MTTKKDLTTAELRKLLTNRIIYIRCGEIRIQVRKVSVDKMLNSVKKPLWFNVEYTDRDVFIEYVNQYLHSGQKPCPVS